MGDSKDDIRVFVLRSLNGEGGEGVEDIGSSHQRDDIDCACSSDVSQ